MREVAEAFCGLGQKSGDANAVSWDTTYNRVSAYKGCAWARRDKTPPFEFACAAYTSIDRVKQQWQNGWLICVRARGVAGGIAKSDVQLLG